MIRDRGFTLLEVLVAIAIFALFSAMAYGSLTRMLDNRERVDAERAFWRELTIAFVHIQDDLALARARKIRHNDGTDLPAFRGQPTDTRAVGEASLEFTRGGVLIYGTAVRADLQRVAYRLRDGMLVRLTWPVLDRAPISEPQETTLLDKIETLQVRFFNDTGVRLDYWPSEVTTAGAVAKELPKAVELTLVHAQRGKFVRTFLVND